MEPVGPSAYLLSLQAQRTPSEQWKMLKNRLLRKKSSEESITPDVLDKIKLTTRSPQEDGIVCRTHELKRLLRESETSDGPERMSRSSNRSSFDENDGAAAELAAETTETRNSTDSSEKEEDEESGRASASKVKWDEVSPSLPD